MCLKTRVPAKAQVLKERQTPGTLQLQGEPASPSHTSDRESQLWRGQSELRKAKLEEAQETVKASRLVAWKGARGQACIH